ncbi:MAG TPA: pre-peptidase C-terminal domain-containing protein, partial [Pyrinomonadaceae bacterium]
ITGHETHTFTVTLEENQFVQLVVEQRGIDVVIRVSSPAGKSLGDFDSPNGDNGPEDISFVAITPGVYRIAVTPLDQGEPDSGKYQIKIIELRAATEQEIKNSKNLEVVKAKGIALLSEIEELIPEIHSPQTRIRAQLQSAQLLWESDEKRASKYLNDAITGVKEFLATVDPGSQDYAKSYSAIVQLRYEIAHVLAGRDPDAALSFLQSSKVPADPYGNAREQAEQERTLELSIADQISAKDPKRAMQIARQNLKSGYSSNLINTVRNLRSKEPELATDLANEIATKLLGEKLLKKPQAAALSINLLSLCNERPMRIGRSSRQPVPAEPLLSEATCRDLMQKAFQEAMSFTPPPLNTYSPDREAASSILMGLRSLGPNLDTVIDGGLAAIEKKVAELNGAINPYQALMEQFQTKLDGGQTDSALESIQKVPDEMKEQAYIQLANISAAKGDVARARQIINDYVSNPYQKRQALANLEQQEMYQAMSHGKVEEALRTIANLRTPRERANMLMQVARQIGTGQKRATALNLLDQARGMLAPGTQAQDQEQMNALLELSRAFARYDIKRAFEIVDPLVDQVNDICTAARTLDRFGPEYFDGEELDLQNGSSVANAAIQMSTALGTLATTNFERAKLTSDRLRLPEVRLRAYLAIAQETIQGVR